MVRSCEALRQRNRIVQLPDQIEEEEVASVLRGNDSMTAQAIIPIGGAQEAEQCLKCNADGRRNQDILETIEDMALRNEEKEWVREEIAAAIQEHLQPHGWRRLGAFLKTWIPLGSALGILIALLALAGAGWNYSFSRVDKEARFQTTTEATLKTVQADIAEIKTNLTKQSLVSQANLPLANFKATLSELGASVATARKQNLKIPSKVVDGLTQKMTAIGTNAPDFWPVAAELISYRSQTLVAPIAGTLPNCVDSLPVVSGSVVISSPTGPPKVNPGIYKDCQVTLDSEENGRGIAAIQMQQPSLIFKHCLVVYRGGPIEPIIGWHIYEHSVPADKSQQPSERKISIAYTLVFEDCLFDFAIEGIPPADGQKVTEAVLAQTGNRITLPKA